jgi:hypothetical protein
MAATRNCCASTSAFALDRSLLEDAVVVVVVPVVAVVPLAGDAPVAVEVDEPRDRRLARRLLALLSCWTAERYR